MNYMRQTYRNAAALAISLVSLTSAASATTYYVSPTGKDTNTGTSQSKPWKTIAKVNTIDLAPGDKVLFQGGKTFAGTLSLGEEDKGTASKLITIGSYGSGCATIDAGTGGAISAYNTAGIRVENLKVKGAGRANGNQADGISFYTDIPIWNNKLDTVQVDNVEASGFGKWGVSLGSYAYDYVNYVAIKTGFKNVRFTNLSLHDNDDGGLFVYGSFNSYWGADFPESLVPGYSNYNVYVGNCVAYRNKGILGKQGNTGNGLVLSDVDKGVIEYSVAYENGENNDYWGGGPIGIWAWESNDITIQFNEAFNNHTATIDGGGFDLDGGCTNSVMQFNLSYNNDGNGYLVYEFYSARPMANNIVRYNVSINDGRTNGGGLAVGGGTTNQLFHDNVVTIGSRPASQPGGAGPYAAWVITDGWNYNYNATFRNNTFITTEGVPLVYVPDLWLQPGITFKSNNYLPIGPFSVIWDYTPYNSLKSWRAATGQER